MNKLIDDHDFECTEIRVLPSGGSSNILVGKQGYLKEIKFRKERNNSKTNPVWQPFDLPAWEDLEVYATMSDEDS